MSTPILIGTNNRAKFNRYKTILGRFPHLRSVSPEELHLGLRIEEDGLTAAANAYKKARAYVDISRIPTLGIDEAFTLPAMADSEQPGTNVRRYMGKELSDEELLEVFLNVVRRLAAQDRVTIWIYAFCLALPNGQSFSDEVELRKSLAENPSFPILPGYPLSSLLIDENTGKILRDLTQEEEQQHLLPVYNKITSLVRMAGLDK